MAIDPGQVRRYEHGSRVPGWDRAADLSKDPSVVPDPATTPVPKDLRAQIEAAMARYPDVRSAAIPGLWAAQHRYGWLPPSAIEQVACVMRLTPGYLIAVATFYDMFETEPVGEHTVYVCTNISCSLRGADDIYEEFHQAAGHDANFNVRHFECLGACDIAPMASVNDEYIGPLEPGDPQLILDALRAGETPLPDKHLRNRRAPQSDGASLPAPPIPEQPGPAVQAPEDVAASEEKPAEKAARKPRRPAAAKADADRPAPEKPARKPKPAADKPARRPQDEPEKPAAKPKPSAEKPGDKPKPAARPPRRKRGDTK